MKYELNKEYPEVKVERKNIYYANLLLSDYAGINSELTAVTRYVYQNFNLFKDYPSVAQTISKIAVVEMRHLELLGKTIKLLGINPEFKFENNSINCFQYWNSSYVSYDSYIISLLKYNILSEQIAIKNYTNHLNIINDKYIKKLIARIIEDEKLHIKCFKILLDNINKNK